MLGWLHSRSRRWTGRSPKGCTSRFILFAPGSNHSFVDGPLTRVAPLRESWLPAREDAMGSLDCSERGGAGETLFYGGGALSPPAFNFATHVHVAVRIRTALRSCSKPEPTAPDPDRSHVPAPPGGFMLVSGRTDPSMPWLVKSSEPGGRTAFGLWPVTSAASGRRFSSNTGRRNSSRSGWRKSPSFDWLISAEPGLSTSPLTAAAYESRPAAALSTRH